MVLSEIWIYPIKSLAGIRLTEAQVEEKGLQYDRRWMIVDENNRFLTQREYPKMAMLKVAINESGLIILSRVETDNLVHVPFQAISAIPVNVTVWDDQVEALTVSDEVDKWLSEQLSLNVKLVIMPESSERKADPRYAKNNENVSFADGFPFLLISQASLDHLNEQLETPIVMQRFRPNFVVTGTNPHAEDDWKSIQIGGLFFDIVKPCARCVLTTIDPETAEKGKEPLKTLATYRRVNNKILFGQNVVTRQDGLIKEGDQISLLE
ncbi:MOSC domain-containing protein [Dyadobacter sp. CY356]|uniref:MOSC domain-containing protein n=1 Tax=Dyadobacter sp. CY356 TaxID=2906442 RepID=UPI001F310B82|nr:MOSC N-terminal beta barrel domain-containing protein [Dyadobacter sp. CY356]MCF0058242.1 MOSC domain-containing protein [Dyadobacter sp. CY356]